MQVLLVFGPTAVGKTEFVEALAAHINIEVINMDMGQLYEPLTIGTAKPDWKNAAVPHHMFDIMSEAANYSVVAYRTMVLRKINEIRERGALPVLVGGSSFYLKSLLFPIDDLVGSDSYAEKFSSKSAEALWSELFQIDSARANAIHPHDRYRIERALSLWYSTGIKPSDNVPLYTPPFTYSLIYLKRERTFLYDRINKRVDAMVEEGWLDEVRNLDTSWQQFLLRKKLIGYNELLLHFQSPATSCLQQTLSCIKKRTRVYARKQEMFWNMLSKMIVDGCKEQKKQAHLQQVDLTFINLRLYLKQLKEQFSG